MRNKMLVFVDTETPLPGPGWQKLSNEERLARVADVLRKGSEDPNEVIAVTDAKSDGEIIVEFSGPVSAAKRGTLLLDLEEMLKGAIDPGLVVWLKQLGDLNSLRNLRAVEVES